MNDNPFERLIHDLKYIKMYQIKSRWKSWWLGRLIKKIENREMKYLTSIRNKDIHDVLIKTLEELTDFFPNTENNNILNMLHRFANKINQ